MSELENLKSKPKRKEIDKLCLHCNEAMRKPISSANFSRHLKDCHRERYDEL